MILLSLKQFSLSTSSKSLLLYSFLVRSSNKYFSMGAVATESLTIRVLHKDKSRKGQFLSLLIMSSWV